MEEKQNTKLQHTNILKLFLFILCATTISLFYNNNFGDYELIVTTLQNSALVLLFFMFLFLGSNIHLVAGDNRVRKIFDHLIFFSFLYYICVYSIPFLDRLNSGSLAEFSQNIQVASIAIVVNYILLVLVIPILTMITLLWSLRNVRTVTKGDKKKHFVNPVFYIFLILSFLGIFYSLLTPIYSIY